MKKGNRSQISIDHDDAVEALTCWRADLAPSGELSRLCVRKDMQGQGIAKVNICTDLLNAARDNTKDGYAERSYYDSVTLAKDGFKDCLKHYYEVFHTK